MYGLMAISIGIPVYNAEPYLADAIRSVFAQSYSDWELIIVDDGSTDRSLDIAMSIDDPRVRVISDGKNMRLPYRLNQIVRESRYEYVARMDADDLMSPFRLEKQLAVLGDNPHIDLVSTGVCSVNNLGVPVGYRTQESDRKLLLSDMLLGRSGIVHASILARRAWCLRHPYDVDQVLTEDYELWVRAFAENDFAFSILPEPLYFYREEGNLTERKMLRAYSSQRFLMEEYYKGGVSLKTIFPMYTSSLLKSAIVFLLARLGRLSLLHAERNMKINDVAMMNRFSSEMALIKSTKVPGLYWERGYTNA